MKTHDSKFLSSSLIMILLVFWVFIFGSSGIVGLFFTLSSDSELIVINAILSSIMFLIVLISLFVGSKLLYFVQINNEELLLKSIWGVHSRVKMCEIVKIYVTPFGKGDVLMICVEDGKQRPLNMMRKNSVIRFQCSKKSIESLKLHWHSGIAYLPEKFQ